MNFPPIDFDDFADTVPSRLSDLDFDFKDTRADPHVLLEVLSPRRSPLSIVSDKFPRIADEIKARWGTKELQNRFAKWLLLDTHNRFGEMRRGFPRDVQSALLELSIEHDNRFHHEAELTFSVLPDRW